MSRKNISNKLMTLGTDRKKQQNSAKKKITSERIRHYDTGEEGVGTLAR